MKDYEVVGMARIAGTVCGGRKVNKQRRKRLGKAFDLVTEAMDILEEVKSEEEESYDNLPDYIEMLEEASGYLDDANSVIKQI